MIAVVIIIIVVLVILFINRNNKDHDNKTERIRSNQREANRQNAYGWQQKIGNLKNFMSEVLEPSFRASGEDAQISWKGEGSSVACCVNALGMHDLTLLIEVEHNKIIVYLVFLEAVMRREGKTKEVYTIKEYTRLELVGVIQMQIANTIARTLR